MNFRILNIKFYIYDTDKIRDIITVKKEDGSIEESTIPPIDLTATYDRQSESRKAPILVSGYEITLIFRTVMGGPLEEKFNFQYLKPLSIDEGVTLLTKLIKILFSRDIYNC